MSAPATTPTIVMEARECVSCNRPRTLTREALDRDDRCPFCHAQSRPARSRA